MSIRLQVKRRVNGAAGSPADAQGVSGELALNFPGASGATTKPALFAHDGTTWRVVNPDANVTTQAITLGAGANIGAAYTAWAGAGGTLTGNVIIATYGSPAQAYVLTNPALPGAAASWTSLGGAVTFATATDVQTGTDTAGALNSAVLAGAAVNGTVAPVAADVGKYVRVGADGKIASSLLSITALNLKSSIAPTAPAPTSPAKGDLYILSADGTFPASWTGLPANTKGKTGDSIFWDGTSWRLIANSVDLTGYLQLTGGTMTNGSLVTFSVPATAGLVTRIDGTDPTKSAIDNWTIDCSTY